MASEQTGVSQSSVEEDEFDLMDIVAQLLARKWLILISLLLGAVVGIFYGQLDPNQYRAESVVQIEKRSSGVTLPSELIGEMLTGEAAGSSIDTEVHVIKSRLILGPVIEGLGLDNLIRPAELPIIGDLHRRQNLPFFDTFADPKFARPSELLVLDDLEVEPDLIGKRFLVSIKAPDRYSITTPTGEVFEGRTGELVGIGGENRIRIAKIDAAPGREFVVWKEALRRSTARIASGLAIRERGGTGIVDFRYTSGDPELAVETINAVVETYKNRNLQRRSAQIDQSIEFIEQQILALRQELDKATQNLSDFRGQSQTTELSLGTQDLLERAVAVETELEELEYREEQLAQRLTPNHPDYQALIADRKRLEARLAEIRQDLTGLPETEQQLARLTQHVERTRQLEIQLTQRVEQLRILKASTVGNIRVLEPAESARLVGPNRQTPVLAGIGVGFVLSILLVLMLNFFRRGVDDIKSIEALSLPLFATINKIAALKGLNSRSKSYAIALSDPNDIAVESLRGLRTGLQFSLSANKAKSLMLTSCAPSDGKSFVALNLAIVSAQAGQRVLLIDGDMRKGQLWRQFEHEDSSPGLSKLLAGSATFEDVVVGDEEKLFDFIPTGKYPPNPSELLATPAFGELMKSLYNYYDLVIVDAPPALAVTDPSIIGQHVGMTLLVVRHLVTTKDEIQGAMKSLNNSGVHLSGFVLNQFEQRKSRYGSYGGKYGTYYGGYKYQYK